MKTSNSLLPTKFELARISRTVTEGIISDASVCNTLDTRYFMIKSWNSENVEIAQRDVSDQSIFMIFHCLMHVAGLCRSYLCLDWKTNWTCVKLNRH